MDLAGDYGIVEKSFERAIRGMGPLYMFVNCAGMAICGTLESNSSTEIMVIWYKISK